MALPNLKDTMVCGLGQHSAMGYEVAGSGGSIWLTYIMTEKPFAMKKEFLPIFPLVR